MIIPQLLRSLARARALSAASIGMLAVGSGALIATFALVDAVLLRDVPFDHADRLVAVSMTRTTPDKVLHRERWSYARVVLLKSLNRSFEITANYTATSQIFTGAGGPETVSGEVVSPSYFEVLRARTSRGRLFANDEDIGAGAHPVVVLSHELWQRRYLSDASIIGQTVVISGVPFTVIGVAAPGFRGVSDRAEFWIPTTMAPLVYYAEYLTTNQKFIGMLGRLKNGVNIQSANAELAVLGTAINEKAPSDVDVPGEKFSAMAALLADARVDATARRSVLTLFAGVALLYLLACANVANLLLARASSRHREGAVRIALGCGRAALFRFYVAEGVVLSFFGIALGALFAYWLCSFVSLPPAYWAARNPFGNIGTFSAPAFDLRILSFGVVLALVTAALVCTAPALSVFRTDVLPALRAGARAVAPGSGTLRKPTLRGIVVACEAALAVLLLVAGGLMISTFERIRHTDIGVKPEHVLTFLIRPSEVQVTIAQAPAYIERMLQAITAVPGVVSATVDGGAPANGSASTVLHIVGQPLLTDDQAPPVNRHYVAPDHFRTLGMRVIAGRGFASTDVAGRAKVTVISESAARKFWPEETSIANVIGKRVWFASHGTWGSADSSAVVIGIVNDVLHQAVDANPNKSDFYTPYAQYSFGWRIYFVQTTGAPTAMVSSIRKAVFAVEPNIPMVEVQPLEDLIGQSWARHRFDALLFGGFASLAMLLAAVGIYSVVSYAISQRTREMGIRMALGAHPRSIIQLVVREGMSFPVVGLAAGVLVSLVAAPLLQASLYDVAPTDPAILGGTAFALLAVSALACYLPALRATHVNPTEALRSD